MFLFAGFNYSTSLSRALLRGIQSGSPAQRGPQSLAAASVLLFTALGGSAFKDKISSSCMQAEYELSTARSDVRATAVYGAEEGGERASWVFHSLSP